MECPYCGSTNHNVLESRTTEDGASIRRRRECQKCNKRFTTYERIEGVDIVVIKRDGVKEDFDREKIKRGIMKATWKRPVTMIVKEEKDDRTLVHSFVDGGQLPTPDPRTPQNSAPGNDAPRRCSARVS